jgi:hypothetical protein
MLNVAYDPYIERYVFIPIEGERVEILNIEKDEPRRIAGALLKELDGMDETERVALALLMCADYNTAMENYFNNQGERPPLVAALLQRLIMFRSFHGLKFTRISVKDLRVEVVMATPANAAD